MAESRTSFVHITKQKGDFILAQDWNSAMAEIVRLRAELAAYTIEAIAGNLSVRGNVGIGTTTPQAKLEVVGQGGLNVDVVVNGRLRSNHNDGGLWVATDRFVGGHSTNQIGFWNGNAWRLTVQPDGNVGIGTTTPGAKLSFSNVDVGSEANGITWHNPTPTAYGIHRTAGPWTAPNYQQLRLGWSTGLILDPGTQYGKSYVDIQGNGLRVTAGNVGIGTTAPGNYKLNIGSTGGQSVLYLASDFGLRRNDKLNLLRFGSDGDYQLLHKAAGAFGRNTLAMHVHTDDAFGVYSSNWTSLLEVKGGSGELYVRGNVGIGTTTPGAKLEVSGTVKATRFEGDGSALTGIAVGRASQWVDTSDGTGIVYRVGKTVTIGAANSGTALQILNKNQEADGDALIIGRTEGTNLRLGYHSDYSWIQSHGSKPLAINPLGDNVGIGTTAPRSRLQVHGSYLVVSGRDADDASAKALLDTLPNNSAIVGSPQGAELTFYWKAQDGTQYRAAIAGSAW